MVKVLIIALAVVLLVWLLVGRTARQRKPSARNRPDGRGGAEEMVSCAHCGVHLPRGEALTARSLHFCSAAHRDAPPRT